MTACVGQTRQTDVIIFLCWCGMRGAVKIVVVDSLLQSRRRALLLHDYDDLPVSRDRQAVDCCPDSSGQSICYNSVHVEASTTGLGAPNLVLWEPGSQILGLFGHVTERRTSYFDVCGSGRWSKADVFDWRRRCFRCDLSFCHMMFHSWRWHFILTL